MTRPRQRGQQPAFPRIRLTRANSSSSSSPASQLQHSRQACPGCQSLWIHGLLVSVQWWIAEYMLYKQISPIRKTSPHPLIANLSCWSVFVFLDPYLFFIPLPLVNVKWQMLNYMFDKNRIAYFEDADKFLATNCGEKQHMIAWKWPLNCRRHSRFKTFPAFKIARRLDEWGTISDSLEEHTWTWNWGCCFCTYMNRMRMHEVECLDCALERN